MLDLRIGREISYFLNRTMLPPEKSSEHNVEPPRLFYPHYFSTFPVSLFHLLEETFSRRMQKGTQSLTRSA